MLTRYQMMTYSFIFTLLNRRLFNFLIITKTRKFFTTNGTYIVNYYEHRFAILSTNLILSRSIHNSKDVFDLLTTRKMGSIYSQLTGCDLSTTRGLDHMHRPLDTYRH